MSKIVYFSATANVPYNFSKCVCIQFLLRNILPGLICIWNDVYEIIINVQKHFWKEHLCALQVFLCVCISWLVFVLAHSLEGTLATVDLFSCVCRMNEHLP